MAVLIGSFWHEVCVDLPRIADGKIVEVRLFSSASAQEDAF
ncbi:hypothetical protein [Acidovorax sp.]|nr:hypothetical protein [Acidovorax sp.]